MRQLKFLSFLFFIAFFITNAQAQEQCPGITVVGYGYNVFGHYANNKSVKLQLFELQDYQTKPMDDGQQYNVPDLLNLKYVNEKDYKVTEGSSLRQYAKSMNSSVGMKYKGLFFSTSVETRFGKQKSKQTKNYFYTITDWTRVWEVSINPFRKDNLRQYLTTDAKNAIDNWDASKLFDVLGTHFVSSGYFGGAMEYSLSEKFTSQRDAKSIAASVKARYANVSANKSVQYNTSQVNENFKSNVKIYARGGDVQYANNSSVGDNNQYNLWVKSIPTKAVLIDFKKGSLIPIWTLAGTQARKSELKAEFKRMLKNHPLPEGNSSAMMVSNQVFFIKNLGDDNYLDMPGYNFDALKSNGAKVQVYPKDQRNGGLQGIDRFIKLLPHATKPDFVFLQPQHSDKVFDVVGDGSTPGKKVQLWSQGTTKNDQMFKLVEVDGKSDTYYIENKTSGLRLTSHGKGKDITVEKPTQSENQQWYLEPARAEDMAPMKTFVSYALRNVEANRYVDVGGSGAKARTKNERVQLWDKGNNPDRHISLAKTNLDGWYYVRHNHSSQHYWDIESGNNANGTKLQLWTMNEKPQQHFKFIYAGSAMTFYIQNRDSKKYLDASRSRLGKNGCPVQIWSKNGNDNQKWKLEPAGPKWFAPEKPIKVKVKSAFSSLTWNLKHGGAEKARQKGSKLDIAKDSNKGDRYFTITPSGDHNYVWFSTWVVNGQEKMRIGVDGDPGEIDHKVITWTPHGGDPQKFAIHPTGSKTCVIYTTDWKTLDIEGWGYNEAGADIQTYDPHWKYNQQFQLIDAKTGKPIDFRKYIK